MYQDLEHIQRLCFKLAHALENARQDVSFEPPKNTPHVTITTSTTFNMPSRAASSSYLNPQDSRVLHNALFFQKFLLDAPKSQALAYQIGLEKAVQDICHVCQRKYQLSVLASQLESDQKEMNDVLSKMRQRGVFYDRYEMLKKGQVFEELKNLKFDNLSVTVKLLEKEKVVAFAQKNANAIFQQLKLSQPNLTDQPLFKPKI